MHLVCTSWWQDSTVFITVLTISNYDTQVKTCCFNELIHIRENDLYLYPCVRQTYSTHFCAWMALSECSSAISFPKWMSPVLKVLFQVHLLKRVLDLERRALFMDDKEEKISRTLGFPKSFVGWSLQTWSHSVRWYRRHLTLGRL